MKKALLLLLLALLLLPPLLLSCGGGDELLFEQRADGTYLLKKYKGSSLEVSVPASYQGKPVTEIGERAFAFSGVVKVTLPDTVTIIGENAFEGCRGLQTVSMSEGLLEIRDCAFLRCENLNHVTLPESLCLIGKKAFYACTRLRSLTFLDPHGWVCTNEDPAAQNPDYPRPEWEELDFSVTAAAHRFTDLNSGSGRADYEFRKDGYSE